LRCSPRRLARLLQLPRPLSLWCQGQYRLLYSSMMFLLIISSQEIAKNSLDPRKGHPSPTLQARLQGPDAINGVATCQLSMDNMCYFYSTAPQIHEPGKSSSHSSHNHITILEYIIFHRDHKLSNKIC